MLRKRCWHAELGASGWNFVAMKFRTRLFLVMLCLWRGYQIVL